MLIYYTATKLHIVNVRRSQNSYFFRFKQVFHFRSVINSDNKISLVFCAGEKSVHVFHIYISFGKQPDYLGKTAGSVVYLNAYNIVDGCNKTVFFKKRLCFLGISDDQPQYSEFTCVGNRQRPYIYTRFCKYICYFS